MALLRFAATIGGYTMASRVLGFLRDMAIAAVVGAGPVADAFFVAFKLPNFFRRLFAEGAFNAAFVPLYSRMVEREGEGAARRFAEAAMSALLTTLLVFTLLFEFGMPWFMHALAPGFADDPAKFQLSIELTRITFPYLLFISLVSLLGGVLNSLHRFAAVAAAPILMNLAMLAGLFALKPFTPTAGHALAWGVAAAGLVQFLWLIAACRRVGVELRLPRPRLSPKVKELLWLMLPAALGAGVVQVNLVVDVILASLLPDGSVSYLFYADRLNQLPVGVVGIAIGTALLPVMSRQLAAGDEAGAMASVNRSIEMVLLLTLPATVAFVVAPFELVGALFQRGAFGPKETQATALALVAFALGLPAYVMNKALTPPYYARHDTRTPVVYGVVSMLANIAFNLVAMQYLAHVGLALGTAFSAWLNNGMLWFTLRKRGWLRPDARLVARTARIIAASGLLALAVWGGTVALAPWFSQAGPTRWAALAALVAGALIVYAVAALALRAVEPGELRALARRGRR
jgi:putative peptidoglycan lipid II flippase